MAGTGEAPDRIYMVIQTHGRNDQELPELRVWGVYPTLDALKTALLPGIIGEVDPEEETLNEERVIHERKGGVFDTIARGQTLELELFADDQGGDLYARVQVLSAPLSVAGGRRKRKHTRRRKPTA